MNNLVAPPKSKQTKALSFSTLAFGACFAVWTIFSIIGVQIKNELGLNNTQFGILVATPILTGSVSRIFLGIWADQIRRAHCLRRGNDRGGICPPSCCLLPIPIY